MKILQVLAHSAFVFSVNPQSLLLDGWHTRVGRELAKRYSCEVECLTFDPRVERPLEINIRKNLTLKAFRSISFSFGYEYSRSEIEYIERIFRKERDVILHIHGFPTFFTYALALKLRHRIVVQDHGGGISPLITFWNLTGRYISRFIDYIFVPSKLRKEYLIRHYGFSPTRIRIQTMGVDLNVFRPLSQEACRNMLHLPHGVKLVLYVGRFDDYKGLPLIIREISKLKSREDVELVCVGGVPSDPLYPIVKKLKFCFERVPNHVMPYFYNSCDLLAYFWKDTRWGGPSVSVMEAMACNKPIVSNTLMYSGIDKDELEENGCYVPLNKDEFGVYIRQALLRNDCTTRKLAEKYFGWDAIISSIVQIYNEILKKNEFDFSS